MFLSQGSRDEPASKLSRVMGEFQFRVVIKLRFPLPYQLFSPSRGCLHSLANDHLPPSSKLAMEGLVLLML